MQNYLNNLMSWQTLGVLTVADVVLAYVYLRHRAYRSDMERKVERLQAAQPKPAPVNFHIHCQT